MVTREQTPESNDQMLRSLAQQMEEQTRHAEHEREDGKPEKTQKILFGLFDIPSSLAPVWDFAANFVQPRIRLWAETGVRNYGDRIFGKHTKSAANALGWTYTFASPIQGAVQAYFTERGEYRDLNKRLAHVTESLGATSLGDNEILAVENKRIGMHFKKNFMTDVGSATVAAIPQAILKFRDDKRYSIEHPEEDGDYIKRKRNETPEQFFQRKMEHSEKKLAEKEQKNKMVRELAARVIKERFGIDPSTPEGQQAIGRMNWEQEREYRQIIAHAEESVADKKEVLTESKVSDETVNYLGSALSGVGAVTFRKAFERQAENTQYKETALDKIEELCKHIDDRGLEGLSVDDLSTRIQEIFNAHQLTMGQREVRQVDREDFERASRQIAEAITNFELDPMGLVLLVGSHGKDKDRMILKKQGKQIATFDETEAAIKKVAEVLPARAHLDPHKFEQELGITAEKQKAIVDGVPAGAAKDFYIAELPQSVAKLHGIADKDYVEIKNRAKPTQDAMRRLAVLDLLVMPDDVLKAMNFKDEQIAKIREVGEDAIDGGSKPVRDAMSKGTLDGIEMLVLGAGAYWDKFISGELKEVGHLWRQLGPKYMEERETKRAQEDEKEMAEEAGRDEKKSSKHDRDSDHGYDSGREEGDKKKSSRTHEDKEELEHDEIKDERFPKTRKSKDRDYDLAAEEDEKPTQGKSGKRFDEELERDDDERADMKGRKMPSSLLAKGKRDLDSSLGENASRDL